MEAKDNSFCTNQWANPRFPRPEVGSWLHLPHHLLLKANRAPGVGELYIQADLLAAAKPASGYSLLGREAIRVEAVWKQAPLWEWWE